MSVPESDLRLPTPLVEKAVAEALAEDLSEAGDITTMATVAPNATAFSVIAARKPGVVAGLQVAEAAFRALDANVSFEVFIPDGGSVEADQQIARVGGNARALLTAERVALNFLGHMSGIATLTRAYVEKTSGTHARIIDTRKTTPGLRAFEKLAVRAGGGLNHRFGLFDAFLIKDNHIIAAGGIGAALNKAREHAGHMVKVEIEVATLKELKDVLAHKPDAVLLDNMPVATLK
ncbi:MAG: carboxylating nicotinate-nucleotide diphosphorylase, partial [Hyphomicrobium sp.]